MKPKYIPILIVVLFSIICISIHILARPADTRDYSYEYYCDSIWSADKDYYMDVLAESEEYQDYIQTNGEWWH